MTPDTEIITLIRKLRFRLGQADNIAQTAETCAMEGCGERSMRLLEEVKELTRDAGHLVQASMIVTHADIETAPPPEMP